MGLYDDVIVFDHVEKRIHAIHYESVLYERRTFAGPFKIYYMALGGFNPSPYMAYLQDRDCIYNGFLKSQNLDDCEEDKHSFSHYDEQGKILNRPLAGIIQQGTNEKEDQKLELKLLHDAKQCVEHVMLVDLARNDVGKVSKLGTTEIKKLMNIERYSHVMYKSLMLDKNLSTWDALRVSLLVGIVIKPPKVWLLSISSFHSHFSEVVKLKVMQLIDELEDNRRRPYSSGFGSVTFTRDMDIALALCTMVFPTGNENKTMYYYIEDGRTRKQWVAHLQAKGYIVTDNDPNDEHQTKQSG
ncbi:hypothetical protein ACFE04_018873 [Oxalis oulophora]